MSEEVTARDLAVTGTLPAELDGRYLRNGPNPVRPPDASAYAWFTGDGMVHGVRLRDGRAEWYRNRWVRSGAVATALGQPVPPGPRQAGIDHAANTNIVGHAGQTLAIMEGGSRPYLLTDALDTAGPTDFDGTLKGGYTAHPKRDPETGELHAVSYFWGWGRQVEYTITGIDGRVRTSVDVEVGGPASIHDMSITEKWAVIYDLPVQFDLGVAGAGSGFPYRWKEDYQSRLGLVAKDGQGPLQWFDVDPCYVFHALNAFDDGETAVLDVIVHDRVFDARTDGPGEADPRLERWTAHIGSGVLRREVLDERPQEFPRVDEWRVGRPYRYGYASQMSWGSAESAILRHDLERHTTEVRRVGRGTLISEPIFVAREADASEDDGWILVLSFDEDRGASDLVVVNAADFTGEPQAVVHLPVRVPAGFHGNWVPTACR